MESNKLIYSQEILLKGQKQLKDKEEQQSLIVEDINISNTFKEQIEKFIPPICPTCPNRKSDRICVNKSCGPDKYLSLICGKCHSNTHSQSTLKPEMDIQEFFMRLAAYLTNLNNDNKSLDTSQMSQSSLNIEQTHLAFERINELRCKFSRLKQQIQQDIQENLSGQQRYALIQDSITKALSKCEHENIQKQLRDIKSKILFEKNNFYWNDYRSKFNEYEKNFEEIDSSLIAVKRAIGKSFLTGPCIDLNLLEFLPSKLSIGYVGGSIKAQSGSSSIQIGKFGCCSSQFYLDYSLDPDKKYKMLFEFQDEPGYFIMIGIMPLSLVHQKWVSNVAKEYFCKRFFNSCLALECGNIVRGQNIGHLPKKGTQIEMRFDISNSFMEFSDYPSRENINRNHPHFKLLEEEYVITITLYEGQSIVVKSFEEVTSFD